MSSTKLLQNPSRHTRRIMAACAFFIISGGGVRANIRLPQLVGDRMVLQRDTKLKIWGWAGPGEKVSIVFNGKEGNAITNAEGRWLVLLPAMKAGGPFSMTIKGINTITLQDILIGDVWFCSGQSNMVLPMERVKEKYPDDIANADYPQIRNFFVPPLADVGKIHDDLPVGKWMAADPKNVLGFGAASYFFARDIYLKYHIPIGIINSSVGGTPIEAWIGEDGFDSFPQIKTRIKNFGDTGYMNNLNRKSQVSGGNRDGVKGSVPELDQGLSGPLPWYAIDYVPEGWHGFWLPGYWADQGVKGLNGTVWFRKEIDVPISMTGKPAKLFMGRIVDADQTYVNGVIVGSVTYQYPPRRYELPAGLLKPGKNIIVVKVLNRAGKGGFVPDKPYFLGSGSEKIDLRGEWRYKVGQVQDQGGGAGAGGSGGGMVFSAQNSPTGLYNTMVAPAINYSIKGFVWYQGEANSGRPLEYAQLLPALISDWRRKWQEGELPFLYVQLPNFMEVDYSPSESTWAELRESQLKTLSVSNTGMAVSIDAGEWNDIHPLDKKDIGDRLALAGEHLAYGDKDLVYSGPIYQSFRIEENKIIVRFSNTGSGLVAKGGGALYYFSIAGADKKYLWAKATIDGDRVIVWNDNIANPVSVRYAWADNPEGANLYNKEGLPASPFQTNAQ
jgi:sialate O-acetylesterase